IRDSLWTTKNNKGISGISVNDNFHLKYDNLQTKSRSYLANAARKMVCIGIKPDICSVIIQYNQDKKSSRLFLKGFKEMAQVLRLRITSPTFAVNKSDTDGIAAAAGSKIGADLLPKGFQKAGDFISILGSHRGELGGGIYFHKIRKSSAGERPVVDLNMEPRIQDVVYTGITSGLIQSAKPVSAGGLVIALAQVLSESRDPLGARVFLARKLRNDELLFGETQGMVLLSIKENDLMEFERVCMALGVPTTTIGRVTDTGLFNFNDIVNLTVKDIKSNS
ncbi:MAG: AIR synthase-related protein, partial [Candidatus Neomarinimicrobiota bacterium]